MIREESDWVVKKMNHQNMSWDQGGEGLAGLIGGGVGVRRHRDLLEWLQGDCQKCLPHDILIAAWGNFDEGAVQHDLVSRLPAVRSCAPGTEMLPFLLARFHQSWVDGGRVPCDIEFREFSHFLGNANLPGTFSHSLAMMRSASLHGLTDRRGKNECLYVFLSASTQPNRSPEKGLLSMLLPTIDFAFRQVLQLSPGPALLKAAVEDSRVLSERETEIMAWVAMGKTNLEIGRILNISGFTVKNHMQKIFQKLNVLNRAQAVSQVTRVLVDV